MRQLLYGAMTMVALAFAGCGGGGITAGGGISGSGKVAVRLGPLETDGAVVVAGVTFDAGAAVVTVSGVATPVASLRKGMVALVTGLVDGTSGTAETVQVEEVLKGTVDAKIDAVTMVVLGQTVEITPDTVFESGIVPASLDGLQVGDPVEVYGFLKSLGVVSAARVEKESNLSEFRVVGIIQNLDANAMTFDLGAQGVDYSSADTSDLPGGVPANGQIVEVRAPPGLNGNNEVMAERVKSYGEGDAPDDVEDVEIEGFVTSVTSATEFVVGTQAVQTNGTTVFEGGTSADVVVGIELEVEGSLAAGVLVAREVEFGESVKLESDVASVVGNTITLVGLPGISVQVNASTSYEGSASSLGDVMPGEHVRIRGRVGSATTVIATRVDERSPDTDVELQGPVDAAPAPSDPTFSILGHGVDTTGLSDGDFEGESGAPLGRAGFFATALSGKLVSVQGTLAGSAITWDEVELEGDDE